MSVEYRKESFLYQVLKAAVIAALIFVLFAALVAIAAKYITFSVAVVKILGVAAKIFSLLFAATISFRGEKGWLKGLLSGVMVGLLTSFVFLAAAECGFGWEVLWELLIDAAIGMICGMLKSVVSAR